ncbi:MAG: DUF4760 domain-containing protein [Candidatus Acidiferrales bacterium]
MGRDFTLPTIIKKPGSKSQTQRVEFQPEGFGRKTMAKKPTVDDARLILELYNLKREAEMRKARQWWLREFWPNTADEYMKVAMAMGTDENNWLRQVISYWGIAASFVENGVLNEKLFFTTAFCGELFFIFAKVRPFLKELREKTKNPELMLSIEKLIMGSKLGRARFANVEPRVQAMRPK